MLLKNKIFTNSFIYIFLGFLTPAVNFLLLPIYTSILEAEDYALITQSSLIQSFATNIIGYGVNSAFSRYFYDYYKDKSALHNLYSTALISYLLTGLVTVICFSLIGELSIDLIFKNDIFTYWEYGIYSIMTGWFYNLQTVTLTYFRNQEKAISYAIAAIFFFLSVAGSIYIGVVILEQQAKGSILGRFFGSFIPVALYLIYYYLRNKPGYSLKLNKEMLVYGLPIVPYMLLNVFLAQVDKLAIERFLDIKALGLYGFAFLIASINDIFINAVNSAVTPQIYRTLANLESDNKNESKLKLLMNSYISSGLFVNIGISVAGAIGVHYFTNEKYNIVAPYIILLSIAYIPRVFFTNYTISLFYYKKTKILPVLNLTSLLISIITLVVLIPLLGITGACIARIIIMTSQAFFALIYIKRHGYFRPDSMNYNAQYIITILVSLYITLWFILPAIQSDSHKYFYLLPLLFVSGAAVLMHLFWQFRYYQKSISQ